MRFILISLVFIFLQGCGSVQDMEPVVSFKSNNIISLELPGKGNPTAKVYDVAINHCKKFNLFANYKSVDHDFWNAKNTHTFACEQTKTDDALTIAAIQQEKANRDAELVKGLTLMNLGASISNPASTRLQTTCTTYGNTTTCN